MAISIGSTWQRRPLARTRIVRFQNLWQWSGLASVLVVSACLNLIQITREGYANSYYAAAVKSMLQSWHNFFFVSFDPGGFVTIDKPPLGFWIQTASAKLFGFHGWSLLLPEALAGVASVAVLFFLVRRVFGALAGVLAALALALSPISVATSRNNTIDSLLVLTVLLAAWAVLKAAEGGRLRWLLLAMALVGLGFNIKTLEAFLVLPALVLVYLLGAPIGCRRRILHLAAAGVVLAVVSLSWVTTVDLIPASQRPYVGSSQHNSELELALGYNGLQRLLGQGSGVRPAGVPSSSAPGAPGVPGGGGGPGGTGENGPVGVFRLLDTQLGGQIGWLIPAALIGVVAAWQAGLRRRPDRRHQSLILWGVWFLTCAVFFSRALFFHRYYLSMLAPAIAALFGIGAVALWQAYRRRGLRGWLLPLTLVVAAGVQMYILRPYTGWSTWLTPLVVVPCVVAALTLVVARWRRLPTRALAAAAGLGLLALLVAPAVWSGDTVRNNAAAGGVFGAGPAVQGGAFGGPGGPPPFALPSRDDGSVPGLPPDVAVSNNRGSSAQAGNAGQPLPPAAPLADEGQGEPPQGPGGFVPGGPGGGISKQVEQFLVANQGSANYLVVVSSAGQAEQLILDTGKPVMAMGGFTGSDPILTSDSFAALVQQGVVRFVMLGGMGGGQSGGQSVSSWVQTSCTPVTSTQLQGGASDGSASSASTGSGGQLYDCSSATK